MPISAAENAEMSSSQLYLGLPMWSHSHWQHSVYQQCQQSERLARYAQVFNTVEGNTTFYATPSLNTVNNWASATDDNFRFTFKLPKSITHEHKLHNCQQALAEFFNVMAELHEKVGVWKIQLPSKFGPRDLPILNNFLTQLPADMQFGVEVRHREFFAKGDAEKLLNRMLIEHNCNRIIMDTRAVFAAPPTTAAIIDAHEKKPKVPVHPIATAENPIIRFVGEHDLDKNQHYFNNWLTQIPKWLAQGKQPYLFIHTPDNDFAPEQAIHFYQQLRAKLSNMGLPTLANIELPQSNDASQDQLDLGF
ncbi:DUF72 domain-containing protein [Shewanella sp. WXL01]|uniref:DUF72 domain-containing protein n=1 Tax=Shewanella sp. WXL01 TaxID=2709721 RepID=UPI001FD96CCA|nr:DUF72 domain-containing protein [Shewanella sp. WXL01]